MKEFAVIGNPVSQSLSPDLHNYVYKHLGIDAKYKKIMVQDSELEYIIDDLKKERLLGVNITIPHKQKIIKYIDDVSSRAKLIGAINIIYNLNNKLIGDNTDWLGLSMSLKKNNIGLLNKNVILIGAGGTAKSVIFALKNSGVNKILLLNRTLKKAVILKDNIIRPFPLNEAPNIVNNDSIIINTTSVGMQSEESPLGSELIQRSQIIIDVIYSPLETSIIKFGKKVGAKTLNGLDMFIFQALASIDLWFGKNISNKVNFIQLKTYLERKLC